MQAQSFRSLLESMLPLHQIRDAIARLGVQRRERLLDPVQLVYSLVLMGGTSESGRIAAVIRDYFERGGAPVARSSYYKWFDEQLLALMSELSQRCLAHVAGMPKHLPGLLAGCVDWRAVDSTVVKLDDALASVYPGTGEYASLKVHKVYSLGVENVVGYHITPGRRHDGPELVLDESWRGCGLLVDLGYAGFDLLRACRTFDVQFVMRLKEGWNVFVDQDVDEVTRAAWRGVPAENFRDGDFEIPETETLDLDVRVGPADAPIRARLVGFRVGKEYWLFLTSLPRHTHTAEEVAMLYRLRWCIEIDNKLAKTGCQLDEITAERPVSAQILVHASMIASMIANALVHLDHVEQGAVGTKTVVPKHPPMHAMVAWKILIVAAPRLAELMTQREPDMTYWIRTANNLTRGAGDPNWRRKPSPIDRVKGRTPGGRAWQAGRPREAQRA